MKKIYLLIVLISVITASINNHVFAQPEILWSKTFGGPHQDNGCFVQQTADGGFVILGSTGCSGSNTDIWLIKTDSNGQIQWTKTYGDLTMDYGASAQQTSDDGYVILGIKSFNGAHDSDVYLIKTDAKGDTLWSKTFNNCRLDNAYFIQQTFDSGYIITGATEVANKREIWLIKIDSLGQPQWTKTYGLGGYDRGFFVQQTSDGGFILTGEVSWTHSSDIVLIKTDAAGNKVWQQIIDIKTNDLGTCVRETPDGGYILTGETDPVSQETSAAVLIKTDASGNIIWSKTYEGECYARGRNIQLTADGGFIVTGLTSAKDDRSANLWLMKTDKMGQQSWTISLGDGSQYDYGSFVQQTSDGGYIVTGFTSTYGAGAGDIWLIRIGSTTGIQEHENIPTEYSLEQNYPNPFNPSTTVSFQQPVDAYVNLSIFNTCGQLIATLVDGYIQAGHHSVKWHGENFGAGVYFYKLTTGDYSKTRKMIVIK